MKICILTPRFPFPENGGDVLRINNIARYLKSRNHELVLVSFFEADVELKDEYFKIYDKIYTVKRSKVISLFMSLVFAITGKPIQCGYYFSFTFLEKLKTIIQNEQPDFFISHLLRMVPYLELTHQQNNSIIEMTDALSKTYGLSSKAKGNLLKRIVYKFERILIHRYERFVINNYPKVILVSNADVEYLKNNCKHSNENLAVYTNGVECLPFLPNSYNEKKICFIGNMRTLQNQDAVLHFVNDIFPIIKKSIPEAVFTIIGAQPPENIKALDDGKNIIVTGYVDDINATVAECCLNVAPVRVAAGIQNKVLVAMGCGVPVIMSSLIASAIPELKDGINCYIKDESEEFAEECIAVMKDEKLRASISKSGYEMVKQHYSWNEKLKGYEQNV